MSNNSNNQRKSDREKSGSIAAVCLVVCFVAVLTVVGTYTFNKRDSSGNQVAMGGKELSIADPDASKEASNEQEERTEEKQTTEETTSEMILNEDTSNESQEDENTEEKNESISSGMQETSVAPQGELSLSWPVEGNVLMSYSMDKTVYFKTLNQYKYNPAMLIQGKVGDEVKTSATGTISSVEISPQTGTTVTMNIGNGYAVVYGQLKEVSVKEGDFLDTGTLIGYLSEPTKYYSEEGCNLYYQVLENGNPVNPMDYLDSDQ